MPLLPPPCASTTFLTKTSIYDASNNVNAHFQIRCQMAKMGRPARWP